MVDTLTAAVVIEGVVICGLSLAVLAHSRLLGLLHMRLGPAGAKPLADGPAIATRVDDLTGKLPDGRAWKLDFPQASETVLVFVSPQCETCNALLPHVKDFIRQGTGAQLTLVSTVDDVSMNRAYIAWRRIGHIPYVLGEELARRLDIEATPYALRIDQQGIVRAKGIVNTAENLTVMLRQDLSWQEPNVEKGDGYDAMAPGP